ncbi:putative peptidoglycan-binding domain-containing protein [Dysgonomonas macrotermitis]|uniref:Predicted Peptidoglycan domain-containing protein n=1 Tax=Dysgonomonas macrotermitis TaxID=1346286 RepID=A0A1M5J4K8_9BACT|nr:Predicted Peptidoglycan domain-containing protein [Dysgonomonas macrotermitis]
MIIGPERIISENIEARKSLYESIIKKNPSQRKFLAGWMNRINDLKFEE